MKDAFIWFRRIGLILWEKSLKNWAIYKNNPWGWLNDAFKCCEIIMKKSRTSEMNPVLKMIKGNKEVKTGWNIIEIDEKKWMSM